MIDASEEKKMDDPFSRLEKDEEDKVKASEQHQVISKLYDISQRRWSDPWAQSQKLRKTFREEKKVLKAKAKLTEDIRDRSGLHIDLLPETEEDTIKAQMVDYDGPEGREAALRRRELKNGSLVLGKRNRSADIKKEELGRIVKINTRERADPFLHSQSWKSDTSLLKMGVKVVKKRNEPENGNGELAGLVDGYTSDSE